jgi:hypothetical protein
VTYQLRQIAQLEAIKALSFADPVARKEALRLARDAAQKDIAVARWRGEQPARHIASLLEICVERLILPAIAKANSGADSCLNLSPRRGSCVTRPWPDEALAFELLDGVSDPSRCARHGK